MPISKEEILQQAKTTNDQNTLNLLVSYANEEIHFALLENPNLTYSQKKQVAHQIANHNSDEIEKIKKFIDIFIEVREGAYKIAMYAPIEKILPLFNENTDFVNSYLKSYVFHNRDIPLETLVEYSKSSDTRLKEIALCHKNTTYDILASLLDDKDEKVREIAISAISEVKDIPEDVMLKFAKSSNIAIKRELARNKCSAEVQFELLNTVDEEIYKILAIFSRNVNVLRSILHSNISEDIITTAAETLNNHSLLSEYLNQLDKINPVVLYTELKKILNATSLDEYYLKKILDLNNTEINLVFLNSRFVSNNRLTTDAILDIVDSNDPRFIDAFLNYLNNLGSFFKNNTFYKKCIQENNKCINMALIKYKGCPNEIKLKLYIELLESSNLSVDDIISIIASEALPETELLNLIKTKNIDTKILVAISQHIHNKDFTNVYTKLSQMDNIEILQNLVNDSDCPRDILFDIAKGSYGSQLAYSSSNVKILLHYDCSESLLMSFIKQRNDDIDLINEIIKTKDITDNLVLELIKSPYDYDYATLLKNHSYEEATIAALAEKLTGYNNLLLNQPNCPKSLIIELAKNDRELLANPKIDYDTLMYIVSITDSYRVLKAIIENPNLPPEDVQQIRERLEDLR